MPSLTMPEAQQRAALVRVEAYEIDVDLTGGPDTFRSTTTVRFAATRPGAATFVEVHPVRLRSARLNGSGIDPGTLAGGRLPLAALRDVNELVVDAEYAYSRASEGMHRFVDPADGEVYIYAQPSIAQAPTFMACFDQPDLKAPVTVRVRADPRWVVCASGEPKSEADGVWLFEPTPPIATYLITLTAGPYHVVRSAHDGIPLGLYARASLAEHLRREAPELLEVTAGCLDRFHELFGIRYPFDKYDQVFAPELSWGAMEFPGCVLIRDEEVFRSTVTDAARANRAALVAHEMAHMWFGNLVTMRWWDDLWLNESFADYLGWRVAAEATRFRSAWAAYAVRRKVWGLTADQRPSTHPVAAAEVADTDTALANFDGISYAKGSAVLRQLVTWVGDEAFRSGLRAYFDVHAYGNATLGDLLAALSGACGRDLTSWAERWLRAPGVDTLRPEAVVADGRYRSVRIHRSGPGSGRPHRLGVAVYGADGGAIGSRVMVDIDADRTEVPGLAGARAGALLVVNDGDLTYAKVRLERAAEAELADLLPRIDDPVTRALLWTAAWDACRDAEFPARSLAELAASALPVETDVAVFEAIVDVAVDSLVGRYLPPGERPAVLADLAAACRSALARAEPASGWQVAAARALIRCTGPRDAGWLAGWLDGGPGSAVPDGLVVDADLRWLALGRLVTLGAAGEERIAAEVGRDRTARGVEEATRCRAALPDPGSKEEAWRLVMTDRSASNRILAAAATGFWQPEQEALTAPYVPRFFAEVGATAGWRSQQLLAVATTAAYPRYSVDATTLDLAAAQLSRPGLHPIVRRSILDATDELRRAVAARVRGA